MVNSYHKAALSYAKAVCLVVMQCVGTQQTEYELCHQQKELPNDQFPVYAVICAVFYVCYMKSSVNRGN
ncbi:hypothetical protein VCRA2116O372_90081 [Vibrio crassostreae]|nr:hypothetical protein VCRA2116O372_90081 [Vibrio crassostreae]CAK2586878.1 hypothetical protein VCRA2116O374_80081 [Vibrio crassostreae]CAK2598442.1 hypothetical protein VCRA2117O377_90081 [Vibrio crassostreae]CAK2785204.1 hypothetical protein VCRA2119O384_20081 [Vibrio crassostreae]CAK2859054.1 hypothetical protein VCRA2134O405_20081 [Vibrio crassostreae]